LAAEAHVREEEESLLQDQYQAIANEDDEFIQPIQLDADQKTQETVLEAWQIEVTGVDSVALCASCQV